MPDVSQEPAQTDREWLREELARIRRAAAEARAGSHRRVRRTEPVRVPAAAVTPPSKRYA